MNAPLKKRLLFTLRHSPYGASLTRSALDAALSAAAFEQPVRLLFLGEGVLQLLPEQEARAVGARNVGKLLASLPLYDIEQVYVDAAAATRYGIDLAALPVPATPLDAAGMHALMADSNHLLGF